MNMAQPFWALPALAIAGLKARDIMGFCIPELYLLSGFTYFKIKNMSFDPFLKDEKKL